jgi:hypothetical protein
MKYDATYLSENFGKKLNIAINRKYKDLPERKRKAQFKKDFCANQETTREEKPFSNTFHKWIYGGIVPDTVTIIKICNFFDCDIDYFLTEQETFSRDVKSASEVIGLQYDTVDRISRYDSALKGLLDVIVVDNHNDSEKEDLKNADFLNDLLSSLHDYAINYSTSSIKYKNAQGNEIEISDRKQIDNLLRNNSLRECGTILNVLSVEYRKTRDYLSWQERNAEIEDLKKYNVSEEEIADLRKRYNTPTSKPAPKHF